MRAVLFDADGVVQSSKPYGEFLATRTGWTAEEVEAFLLDFWRRAMEADCVSGAADVHVHLGAALADRGVHDDAISFYKDFLRGTLVPDRDVLTLIAELRVAGIVCALATNQDNASSHRRSVRGTHRPMPMSAVRRDLSAITVAASCAALRRSGRTSTRDTAALHIGATLSASDCVVVVRGHRRCNGSRLVRRGSCRRMRSWPGAGLGSTASRVHRDIRVSRAGCRARGQP